jgi:hypothetical protein
MSDLAGEVASLLFNVRAQPDLSVLEVVRKEYDLHVREGDDEHAVFVVFEHHRRRYHQTLTRREWRAVQKFYENRAHRFTYSDEECIGHEARLSFAELVDEGHIDVYEYDKKPLEFLLASIFYDSSGETFDIRVTHAAAATVNDAHAPAAKRQA